MSNARIVPSRVLRKSSKVITSPCMEDFLVLASRRSQSLFLGAGFNDSKYALEIVLRTLNDGLRSERKDFQDSEQLLRLIATKKQQKRNP